MKQKLLFSLLFALLCACPAFAQSYTFSKSLQTYNTLTNTTSLNQNDAWYDTTFTVPIGFQFEFYGQKYSSVIVDTDGIFYFTPTQRETIHVLTTTLSDRERNDTLPSRSPIKYKVDGTAGGRIFKVEFENAGFFPRNTDYINFQVWLYETTNDIEIRYGDNRVFNLNADFDFGGPMVGLRKSTASNYFANNIFLSGSNMQATAVVNSQTKIYMSTVPTEGTTYRFNYTPKVSGLTEAASAGVLQLYPNPAQDQLWVQHLANEQLQHIRITDLSGRTVLEKQVAAPQVQLELANLASGVYFLQAQTKEQQQVMHCFIKQ